MSTSIGGTGDNSKVSFSLAKTAKRQVSKEAPPPAFQQEEEKVVKKVHRSEPFVIPLRESERKTLLERKRAEKSQDELAAEALTEQANLRFSNGDKNTDLSATNFSAEGNLVIAAGKNTNVTTVSSELKEKQQYEKEIASLPDATDEMAYERVPITEFGAALLRGMGWNGKDEGGKAVVPPNMRPHRLGLGATPKLVVPDRPIGKIRTANQVKRDEKLQQQQAMYDKQHLERLAQDKQQTLQVGSIVQIDNNQRAKILKLVGVPGLNQVSIQIEGQATATSRKKGDLSLIARSQLISRPFQEIELASSKSDTKYTGQREDAGIKKESNETHSRDDRRKNDKRKAEHEKEYRESSKKKRKRREYDDKKQRKDQTWLIPNIRVRVVTSKLGSRYYKEKGVVVDVSHRGAATLQMQGGQVLDQVPERYLETALPKVGGNAIVLVGESKHSKGKMLERSSRMGKGVIQIFEDMSVKTLSLDDLAEWVGPLDDDMME
mmetsp:Transcript_26896/g.39789  ORF Transcript_26896/g.39789 Transcript_26896/m.39789 type:complete len:492 (-) Transcript_26896:508-1983(-)